MHEQAQVCLTGGDDNAQTRLQFLTSKQTPVTFAHTCLSILDHAPKPYNKDAPINATCHGCK
eukprot:1143694-Pelagomonas_calceolata.AAC.4